MEGKDIKFNSVIADVVPSTRKAKKLFGEHSMVEIVWETTDGKTGVVHLIYNVDGSWDYDCNGYDETTCFCAIETWLNSFLIPDDLDEE